MHTRGHRRLNAEAKRRAEASKPVPPSPLPSDEVRRRQLVTVLVLVWFFGGFALLMVSALADVGPYAAMQAWEVRHWGSDNLMISVLPEFAIVSAPFLVVVLLPRRPDHPWLLSAREAFWPSQPPAPPSRATMLILDRRLAIGSLVMVVVSLVASGIATLVIDRVENRNAGARLPHLSVAAVSMPGAKLPPYARLIDAALQPAAAWLHLSSVRTTPYADVWTPITGPGWHVGDPVTVPEKDHAVAGERDAGVPVVDGPFEGALSRDAVPAWIVAGFRARGVAVRNAPVVLLRQSIGRHRSRRRPGRPVRALDHRWVVHLRVPVARGEQPVASARAEPTIGIRRLTMSPFHRRDAAWPSVFVGLLFALLAGSAAAADGRGVAVAIAAALAASGAILLAFGTLTRRLPPDLPFRPLADAARATACAPPPDGIARLRVAFARRSLDYARLDVLLDGTRVGQLRHGTVLVLPISPGPHELTGRAWLRRLGWRETINALPGTDADFLIGSTYVGRATWYPIERRAFGPRLVGDALIPVAGCERAV